MSPLPVHRTRLGVALVSLSLIALELALMRSMSLRFWHHFAHMVVSVALLGFGSAGTMLTLLRRRAQADPRAWLTGMTLLFALSIPLSLLAADAVPLQVQAIAWDLGQLWWVLLVELAMLVPFFFAASAVGVVMMDRPGRVAGHYAANLVGSGAGGLSAVGLMGVLTTGQLLAATGAAALLAACVILPWRRPAAGAAAGLVAAALGLFGGVMRYEPGFSPDKTLSVMRNMPGTKVIHRGEGPLGRLDVVSNPAFHFAPWLSLSYTDPEPNHVLLVFDGEGISPVYRCGERSDWRFADYSTAAVGYHAAEAGSVLIIGAGGGTDIGLAAYHRARRIVALELNGQVIDAMRGPLRDLGGEIYDAPGVEVVCAEARGYLASSAEGGGRFDLIQLPPMDSYGAAGAGLHAARESYVYTVESFAAMLGRLSDRGVLSVTRRAWSPPRDGLRVFDTAAEAIRRLGGDPAGRLVMIRSWATVTVLAFARPIDAGQAEKIREFCLARSFDLCRLPGLEAAEANQFHQLDRAYFHEGAAALLGPDRQAYLAHYPYEIAAASDDRPYFHHFFRRRLWQAVRGQADLSARNFLEIGYLMLWAAFVQAAALAAVLVLLPLAPGLRSLRGAVRRPATFAYFLLLGAGFLLLEMGFLQKLILYLAHPIYSAAAVIAGFLVFAGVGSGLCRRWPIALRRVPAVAAGVVVGVGLIYVLVLDDWLALTQAAPLAGRFVVALVTIAPLAAAMGHMFPAALTGLAEAAPPLVPWAWAVNGFASVLAAVAAPLVAMQIGFTGLLMAAIAAYALAGALSRRLPVGLPLP